MQTTREMVMRLTRYRSVLEKLRSLGLIKVFSDNLADALGVSSALVRKDFSAFHLTGNKRGGYKVEDLLSRLNSILGKDAEQKVIIVGCGKIGTALMNYHGFSRERIRVVAGFDTNPDRLAPQAAIPVLDLARLKTVIQKENARVAVLAVPESAAPPAAEQLAEAGIKGILNFAPAMLKSGPNLVIQNINIASELENIFYLVHFMQHGIQGDAD
ncbi:MAG: redox-sensing transcriptional repressor Rex [Kiritimatiellae bacterium]|nr:redox-sensing transcriptional repressor Rex [Kiritimatiellia bacterium]